MKLATTTADFYRYFADRSIAAPLAGMIGTGFRHIDISFYRVIYKDSPWIAPGDGWKKEVEDCLEAGARNGWDFVQAHSPTGEHFESGEKRDALITATRRSIEACAMLGIPHTVSHAAQIIGGTPTEFMKANIAFYHLFEDTAEKYGVDLLTENSAERNIPGYYLRTGREMREFVETADMPRLHLCWDTGHANMRGNDQYRDILDMGNELHALHVQDNFGELDSHLMPMAGTVSFDDVLRGLTVIGYRGYFTFEGSNTLRCADSWPHYRKTGEGDRLLCPPVRIQTAQIAVMREVGKWMLETYGVYED